MNVNDSNMFKILEGMPHKMYGNSLAPLDFEDWA